MNSNTEIVDYIKKSFGLKSQGFYKPAIEMLYKALSLDNENLEILVQLAHLYNLLGNFQRAVYYIEKVLEINPNHLDCLFLLKEIYLCQDNLESAKQVSEKIYEIQPNSANLAQKVNILNKLNFFDEIKKIENTVSNLDDNVLYEIACAYFNNSNHQRAIELLEQAFEKNNTNEKIMFLLGKTYYENNDIEKSKKMFMDMAEINPTCEIMNYLGLFKLSENNFNDAIKYFSKAHNDDKQNAEYLYNLASAYFLNGWLDEALKYFNQAICFDSENINYHYSLAYLYYQKKMYEKSVYELDYICTINPNYELANVLRAMITAKSGDLLAAKEQLENIIKKNKADDFAYSALGGVYRELAQTEMAKEAIKNAIELNPNSLNYLSELAEIEFEQGNYEDALYFANKILQVNDKYLSCYVLLAKIYLELKNFEEVFDVAQNIIELDSNCPEGYYYNAISLFEQGDKNFAIENLKKSISLDLNNASLYIKMSEFYQDLNDLKNAYEWAKEASEVDERNYKYKWLCAKLAASIHNEESAIKHYSQSYRLASFDKDLREDYADYLKSIGKNKQAEKILKD